ncbi:hypothetical protein [Okeania sp. SIO2B3]|uniref:hypothetical protein n=1 Tax=Okeania sp. SIO2B3 TaxID=2607784 RepID=UPI0013C10BC9|nr:hypothetical protein [Okeania sp. SIO2B3]NET46703.1 hypothetical protein [Okeania sp. SIO2B3]
MRYFTYKNRRYILTFLVILIYLSCSHFAFANGETSNYPGSTWQPSYDTSEEFTGSAPTFGVWVCTISSKLTYWLPSTRRVKKIGGDDSMAEIQGECHGCAASYIL